MIKPIALMLLTVALSVPSAVMLPSTFSHAPSARAATSGSWAVRDMGMTAVTHDTVCNQASQATMTRLVSYIPQFHANYASDDVPLDDASGYTCTPKPLAPYAYEKAWATTMHAAGLHVIYRGNWNKWAGDYGMPKLSYSTNPAIPYEGSGGLSAVLSGQDTTSYMGMTYQWILNHADLFQNGDIFEPFGEAQNNGIANCAAQDGYGSCYGTSASNCPNSICQFPDVPSFNKWLSDFALADQAAFRTDRQASDLRLVRCRRRYVQIHDRGHLAECRRIQHGPLRPELLQLDRRHHEQPRRRAEPAHHPGVGRRQQRRQHAADGGQHHRPVPVVPSAAALRLGLRVLVRIGPGQRRGIRSRRLQHGPDDAGRPNRGEVVRRHVR